MGGNLYSLLRSRFPAEPDTPLAELPDGGTVTYGDVDAVSAQIAGLLERIGIQPGDRVAAQVDKSPEALFLYFACLRRRAVFLPLNTAYTPDEITYFLKDAEPALFVCAPERRADLEPIARRTGARMLTLDGEGCGSLMKKAAAATPEPEVATAAADDIAAILYTSGTTGRSKGAMLTHGNLASNALALESVWGWRSDDVLLHALPIYHVHGLFVATHCAMLGGSKMLWLPRFDADATLDRLPEATVMMGVPTYYSRLLKSDRLTRERCGNMRLFISGSAPLSPETWQAFEARTGHAILERYGMTEAGMITSNPLDGERIPGTVGMALPDVRLRLKNRTGKDADGVGVLEFTGPNVFAGYWRKPGETARAFSDDGWFETGDLARIDTLGRVTLVGRDKDLIISGGLNVYPREIENVIDGLPGVAESAVIGLPHADLGEAVAAVVAPDGTTPIMDPAVLSAALSGKLAGFKRPKRIFVVERLPRNAMGKVQKTLLRERYASAFTVSSPDRRTSTAGKVK